jgi:hypothetical protein
MIIKIKEGCQLDIRKLIMYVSTKYHQTFTYLLFAMQFLCYLMFSFLFFYSNSKIQFRLISLVAGTMGLDNTYDAQHSFLLESLLQSVRPQYIIGTCSPKAHIEPDLARRYKTILFAQVGPNSFYQSPNPSQNQSPENLNPYLFGVHLNSDLYSASAIQEFTWYSTTSKTDNAASDLTLLQRPVHVLYSTQSEFFQSTCRYAIQLLKESGFTNVSEWPFDPYADHDNDGEPNGEDISFLNQLADNTCPKEAYLQKIQQMLPALFLCTLAEHNIILKRWKRNNCRPVLIWMTASTSPWAEDNLHVVPYMLGGAQWHESLLYSDPYVKSGNELFNWAQKELGYRGSYDLVVSYSIAVLCSQHLATFYRIVDDPKVAEDLSDPEQYEILRRDLLVMRVDTLFGTFQLDPVYHRNIGRSVVGTQWLPDLPRTKQSQTITSMNRTQNSAPMSSQATTSFKNVTVQFRNKCVSPLLQAEAVIELPSHASSQCDAGFYLSIMKIETEASLLSSHCSPCPPDEYLAIPSYEQRCLRCPKGSTTDGIEASTTCNVYDANLIPAEAKAVGYTFVGTIWFTVFFLSMWTVKHRRHDTVILGHPSLLGLMLFGALLTSSSILFLSMAEATEGQNTIAASKACIVVPFLATLGWILEYTSLTVKAFHLYHLNHERPRIVTTASMWIMVMIAALGDVMILMVWTLQNPLHYLRNHKSTTINSDTGFITYSSVGNCSNSDGVTVWAYISPILAYHASIMIFTNTLLWKIHSKIKLDRYHEHFYMSVASICVCEAFLVGIPIVLAVMQNQTWRFITMVFIVFVNDTSLLLLTFIPKVKVVNDDYYNGLFDGSGMVPKEEVSEKDMTRIDKESARFQLCFETSTSVMPMMDPIDMELEYSTKEPSMKWTDLHSLDSKENKFHGSNSLPKVNEDEE